MAEFVDSLIDQTLQAIEAGSRRILLWGVNPCSEQVVQTLTERGLLSRITGVVEDRNAAYGASLLGIPIVPYRDVMNIEFDTVVVTADRDKESALRGLSLLDIGRPKVILAGNSHLAFQDEAFDELRAACTSPSRAAGYPYMLVHMYQCLRYITSRKLIGDIAEFGVYKGGTTEFMARTLKRFGSTAKVFAFDTFSGFPPARTVLDLYADAHDEYIDDGSVDNRLRSLGIHVIRGDIVESHRQLAGVPLALTFFDTDNYSATRSALEMCYEQTVSGGVLAFDHYFCDERWVYTLGERIAIREVLEGKILFHLHGTGIFLKP